jgi:hypothetical protein
VCLRVVSENVCLRMIIMVLHRVCAHPPHATTRRPWQKTLSRWIWPSLSLQPTRTKSQSQPRCVSSIVCTRSTRHNNQRVKRLAVCLKVHNSRHFAHYPLVAARLRAYHAPICYRAASVDATPALRCCLTSASACLLLLACVMRVRQIIITASTPSTEFSGLQNTCTGSTCPSQRCSQCSA